MIVLMQVGCVLGYGNLPLSQRPDVYLGIGWYVSQFGFTCQSAHADAWTRLCNFVRCKLALQLCQLLDVNRSTEALPT